MTASASFTPGQRPDSFLALKRDIRKTIAAMDPPVHISPALKRALAGHDPISPDTVAQLARSFPPAGADWDHRVHRLWAAFEQQKVTGRYNRDGLSPQRGRPTQRATAETGAALVVNGDNNIVNVAATWAPLPPDPTGSATPEQFIERLHLLRIWAGDPSLRELEEAGRGELRRSTVSDMFKRTNRLPKRDLVRAFVLACGAGSEWPRWNLAWQSLAAARR